jgi:hypothetical protein
MTRVKIGVVVTKTFGTPDSKSTETKELQKEVTETIRYEDQEHHDRFVRNLFSLVSS